MLQPSGHCTTSLSLTVSGNRAFRYLLHDVTAAEEPGSFLSSTDFSPASDKQVVRDKGWFHTVLERNLVAFRLLRLCGIAEVELSQLSKDFQLSSSSGDGARPPPPLFQPPPA